MNHIEEYKTYVNNLLQEENLHQHDNLVLAIERSNAELGRRHYQVLAESKTEYQALKNGISNPLQLLVATNALIDDNNQTLKTLEEVYDNSLKRLSDKHRQEHGPECKVILRHRQGNVTDIQEM
jgi:hypothetical protein